MSKVTPKEFFEGEWYKDGIKKLCADGWPTFVVPVNIQVRNLLEENQKLKEALEVATEALSTYANKESWKDAHSYDTQCWLTYDDCGNEARQALSKIKALGVVKEGE